MNDHLLWYATRGVGAVSLILLSAVGVLGLLSRLRVEGRGWPRFLTSALHADLALMTLCFLALHIVTAIIDPFTHLGLVAATVPFGSYYRTFWLGLGTVAFELLLAVVMTSLLRHIVGITGWRLVHWLAYAIWPLAVVHGLGTGTDSSSLWMILVTASCTAAVGTALVWRVLAAPRNPLSDERHAALEGASRRPSR